MAQDRVSAASAADSDGPATLESLIDSVGGVVFEFDCSANAFSFVSESAERLLGFPRHSWLKPGFWDSRLHPEDAAWVSQHRHEQTRSGRDHELEYRLVRSDGAAVWVRDITAVDAQKRLSGRSRGLLIDVTTRKLAEERAASSESRFRSMAERAGLLAIELDAAGTIVYANEPARRIYGTSLVGRHYQNVLSGDSLERAREAFERRLSSAEGGGPVETSTVGTDGLVHIVRWNAANVLGPRGEFGGVMSIGEDVTERAAYERTLARKAEEFDAIFQLTRDLFFRFDHDGVVVGYSVSSTNELYAPPETFLSRRGSDVLPPHVVEVIERGTAECHRTQDVVVAEYSLPIAGEDREWEARFVPLGGGETAVVVRDVTERKQRAEELRESEERYRTLVELAPNAIYVVGLDDVVLYCNDAAAALLGATDAGTLRGRSIACTLPADFVAEAAQDEARVAAAISRSTPGDAVPISATMRATTATLDGRVIDIERTIAGIFYKGRPALLVIARDITEEIEAQRAVSESRDFLANLLEMLDSGVIVVDGARRVITRANRPAELLLGYEHDEMLGMSTRRLHPTEESYEAFNHGMVDTLGPGEIRATEVELVRRDGTRFDAEVAVRSLSGPGGNRVGVIRDITERKAAERIERDYRKKLSALASELAAAEDSERRRLAEELHDRVSQALAVAMMHLGAVESSGVRTRELAEGRRLLEMAIEQTRAITTELYPPVLHELGLGPALYWLCDETERIHGLTCRASIDESATSRLCTEESTVLFRSARELLMNAVKHARTDSVSVSLAAVGDAAELTVEDHGIGFDVDAVTAGRSSGFGLFSIRERLSHAGGSVKVVSGPGSGTRVTIRMPYPED